MRRADPDHRGLGLAFNVFLKVFGPTWAGITYVSGFVAAFMVPFNAVFTASAWGRRLLASDGTSKIEALAPPRHVMNSRRPN